MKKFLSFNSIDPSADIRRLFLIHTFRNCSFCLPVIIAYNYEMMGLNFAQFMLAETVFAGATMLLEVPTGYLADIWSRRRSIMISMLFWTLSYAYLLVAKGLFDAILVQIMMAFGASLTSGAIQAMLFEYLAEERRESDFRKKEGQRFAFGFYGLALSVLPAGVLYHINPRLPVFLSMLACFIALILAMKLREPARLKSKSEKHPLKDVLDTMRYALHGHKEIAAIILLASLMFTGTKLLMWAQQPYFSTVGLNLAFNGVLAACAACLVGINSQLVHKLDRFIPALPLLGIVLCVEIAIAVFCGSVLCIPMAFILLYGQALYGLTSPIITDLIAQKAEGSRRATILSAQGLLTQMMFTFMGVPFGWITDHQGIHTTLLSLGITLGLCGLPAWLILRKRQ